MIAHLARALRQPMRTAGVAFLIMTLSSPGVMASSEGLYLRDGSATTLAEHKGSGEWLVVMLWSTTCSICRTEFPKYSRFHQQGKGRKVLGIALDGRGNLPAVDAFYKSTGATFPTLLADLSTYAGVYRAAAGEDLMGTPTFMLFNPQGQLVGLNPGPMGTEALERFIARKSQ